MQRQQGAQADPAVAKRAVEEWLANEVERIVGLPLGEPGATAKCATGEYFVSLTAGGIKPEGYDFPAWFDSQLDAVLAYFNSVREFAKDKTGSLYWRERPSVAHENGKWQIYSRLVIA